jgi:hypothetical protein
MDDTMRLKFAVQIIDTGNGNAATGSARKE